MHKSIDWLSSTKLVSASLLSFKVVFIIQCLFLLAIFCISCYCLSTLFKKSHPTNRIKAYLPRSLGQYLMSIGKSISIAFTLFNFSTLTPPLLSHHFNLLSKLFHATTHPLRHSFLALHMAWVQGSIFLHTPPSTAVLISLHLSGCTGRPGAAVPCWFQWYPG